MNLGGFAAGAGADQLETLLARLFTEGQAKIRAQQEQQRIGQEDRRLKSIEDDRAEMRADLGKSRAVQNATRLSGTLRPRQTLDTGSVEALKAGDLGSLVEHEAADLPSTAISGIAQATTAAPLMGQLRMAQAGRPERDTFTGTADQLAGEQAREDSLAARAQAQADREAARQERATAAEQARQDRINAARQAQQDRQDNIRLMAGLRPPTAAQAGAAGADAKAQEQQNEVNDGISLIQQIRSDPALKSSTGPLQGRGLGAVADLEGFTRVKALHDNLVNKLALAQAGKLKGQGPVSNFERDMLAKAATSLQMKLGDADYLNELAKVEQQFQRLLTPGAAPAGPPAGGGAPDAAARAAELLKKYGGG